MQMMKSKLAKAAVVGGVGLGMVGLGAGAASAQPGPDHPVPGQQHNSGPQRDQGPQHNNPGPQQHPGGHGFWFFDHWVPTPW